MTVPTTTTGLEAPTLAPLARCGSGCSRSVKRLVERKFSPTSSGGQEEEEEVSSSTEADGAVAVAALTGRENRRLWTALARRGSSQSQFAFPWDWTTLALLTRWVAYTWVACSWWRECSHQPALDGHLPKQLQEWAAGLWGRQGRFGSPSTARLRPAPARQGFGQQQHSEASDS